MKAPGLTTSIEKLLELLKSYQGRPAAFIENLLIYQGEPVRLLPYQRHFVNTVDLFHDGTTLNKGRQVGGSFCFSADATAWLCTYPYSGAFIVSKTEDQASLIFDTIHGFLHDSPVLKHLLVPNTSKAFRKSKKDNIYLKNGSRIVCRTAGNLKGSTVRGWSVSMLGKSGMLCFDEAAHLGERSVAVCMPLAAGGHGLHFISSPNFPTGAFYKAVKNEDGIYKHFTWNAFTALKAGRLKQIDIDRWKATWSTADFQREALCNFCQGTDVVYPEEDIEAAVDETLPTFGQLMKGDPETNYHYSLDVSKLRKDRYFLTIYEIEKGIARIVAYDSWAGTQWEDQYDECHFTDNPDDILEAIYDYHKNKGFHCIKCYVDATNNEYLAHRLQNHYLLPVEKVEWSNARRKEKLISHSQAVFQARRIRIPDSELIKQQLYAYAFDTKEDSDQITYKSGEDDAISSIAQACQSVSLYSPKVKPVLKWK